mgnify:CR=1 FL=1|tara:strand:+ start:1777 stop:2808 length:1032 start_codon:yes stop_codon:yes gene_type:complete
MVKICFVLPSFSKKTSPVEGILLIIKHLSTKYNVCIIGLNDSNNIKIKDISFIGLKNKFYFEKLNKIKEIDADIYISSLVQGDFICSFIKKRKISLIRSDILKNYTFDKGFLVGILLYLVHCISLKSFDKVLVLTKQNARRLLFNKKKQLIVIRNFFHENFLSKSDVKADNKILKILFAGHLSKRKGIYNLIKVINNLKKSGYKIQLVVLGEGILKEKLNNYVKQNNLSNNIKIKGYVKNTAEYILDCHYTILPSFSEGISRFVMESIFLGKKVIVRKTSGIEEVINEKHSYFFNTDHDLETLLKSMINSKSFLSDPCIEYPKTLRKNTNLNKIERLILKNAK